MLAQNVQIIIGVIFVAFSILSLTLWARIEDVFNRLRERCLEMSRDHTDSNERASKANAKILARLDALAERLDNAESSIKLLDGKVKDLATAGVYSAQAGLIMIENGKRLDAKVAELDGEGSKLARRVDRLEKHVPLHDHNSIVIATAFNEFDARLDAVEDALSDAADLQDVVDLRNEIVDALDAADSTVEAAELLATPDDDEDDAAVPPGAVGHIDGPDGEPIPVWLTTVPPDVDGDAIPDHLFSVADKISEMVDFLPNDEDPPLSEAVIAKIHADLEAAPHAAPTKGCSGTITFGGVTVPVENVWFS